jgi:hypothetical protein
MIKRNVGRWAHERNFKKYGTVHEVCDDKV